MLQFEVSHFYGRRDYQRGVIQIIIVFTNIYGQFLGGFFFFLKHSISCHSFIDSDLEG